METFMVIAEAAVKGLLAIAVVFGPIAFALWAVGKGINQRYKNIDNDIRLLTPDELAKIRSRIIERKKQRTKNLNKENEKEDIKNTGFSNNGSHAADIHGSDVGREADSQGISSDIQ